MKGGKAKGTGLADFQKEIRPEQRIGRIPSFFRKIQLRRTDGPVGCLQADMVVTGPPGIKAWHHRFQEVPPACIRELMPPAAESFQVILSLRVGMPEIEKRPGNRSSVTVKNEARQPDWNPVDTRCTKISSER